MGKTKTKIIDDSVAEEPTHPTSGGKKAPAVNEKKAKQKEEDSLIAKLNAELGIEEPKAKADNARGDSEEVSSGETVGSETTEDAPEDTEEAGPRAEKVAEEPKKEKKAQKPGKTKKVRSKKYLEVTQDLDKNLSYPLTEAIDMVKKLSYAKFDVTLEAHINTIQTGLRGLVSLPFVSGKKLRIAAFGKNAGDCGADIVGSEEIIDEINKGKIDFDILITTPEWMPKLAKVARILGPRNLMPNPKSGTITDDLKKAVESFQAGKTEYKTEAKAPIIHIALGKLSQPTEELNQNVKVLLQTLGKSRIKKVSLTPTMGPSVKLDLSSI